MMCSQHLMAKALDQDRQCTRHGPGGAFVTKLLTCCTRWYNSHSSPAAGPRFLAVVVNGGLAALFLLPAP